MPFCRRERLGNIVLFHQRPVAMIGNGVEIEVEGRAGGQAERAGRLPPIVHQPGKPPGVDAGGVFGEGGAFPHGVEAGEQRQSRVEDLRHRLRWPTDPPELEGQQASPGAARRDLDARRHRRPFHHAVEVERGQHRGKHEQPAEGGAEAAVLDPKGASIGDRRHVGVNDVENHRREPPRQSRQSRRADHLGDGGRTRRQRLAGQRRNDLVDGHFASAPQLQDALVALLPFGVRLGRRILQRLRGRIEERPSGVGVEGRAQIAKAPQAVSERRRRPAPEAFDIARPQRLVAAPRRTERLQKDPQE